MFQPRDWAIFSQSRDWAIFAQSRGVARNGSKKGRQAGRILYEKPFRLKLSGNEVYYTILNITSEDHAV